MSSTRSAEDVLETHYLEVRCTLLNLASTLDRVDRAEESGDLAGDWRLQQFQEALKILQSGVTDRAEQIQMLFSDEYQPGWNQ